MAGAVGAKKAPVQKPYEHQEYPKVLYCNEGKSHLVNSAKEESRLLKHPTKTFADSPADFLPEGHPDRPDTVGEDEEPKEGAGEEPNEADPAQINAPGKSKPKSNKK